MSLSLFQSPHPYVYSPIEKERERERAMLPLLKTYPMSYYIVSVYTLASKLGSKRLAHFDRIRIPFASLQNTTRYLAHLTTLFERRFRVHMLL